jgi:TIR domain
MTKPLAFLSHTHQDQALANALEAMLRDALLDGLDVFNSSNRQSIRPGDPWRDLIIEKLKSCSALLIVATPESVSRPWINFESGAVWVAGNRVIPCCCQGMTPSSLPAPLRDLQGIELGKPDELRLLVDSMAGIAQLRPPTQFDYAKAAAGFATPPVEVQPSPELTAWIEKVQKRPVRYKGERRQVIARVTHKSAVDGNDAEALSHKSIKAGSSLDLWLKCEGHSYSVQHCFAPPEVADLVESADENTRFAMTVVCLGQIEEDSDNLMKPDAKEYFTGFLIESAKAIDP